MPSSNSAAPASSCRDHLGQLALPCAVSALGASALTYFLLRCCCCSKDSRVSSAAAAVQQKATESNVIYETDKSAHQYMEFHFTPSKQLFEPYDPSMRVSDAFDFPIRVARKFSSFRPRKMGRVLDLGCAVGMSSFELTRWFDEVVGIDLSENFIGHARRMAEKRVAEYEGPDQGNHTLHRRIVLDAVIDTTKVRFEVGDAMAIDPALGTFDGLLAANLVCRVPDPTALLQSFAKVINPGGVLVLVSPYSWWDGATSPDKWIGGKPGLERSEVLVKRILEAAGFEQLDECNEPFLIRDHHRRFQLGFSSCTVWRRK
jgi:putative 4-mercaptohistidine N1-methyltranferase